MSITIISDIDMPQGSDAWHEWREDLYTASEAAVIMHSAPSWEKHVKTWDDLRRVHLGLSPEPDSFTQYAWDHGKKSEPKAREQNFPTYTPACIQVDDTNFAASLDGVFIGEDESSWLEIKCPTPTTGTRSKAWKKAGLFKDVTENGRDIRECFEDHHWWQLVHQAMVLPSDFTTCYFMVWLNEDKVRYVPVSAERLRENTVELYDQWIKFQNEEDHKVDVMDPDFAEACEEFKDLSAKVKHLEKLKEQAKAKIKAHTKGHNFEAHGLKTSTVTGRVNWKTACADIFKGEDMDAWSKQFRGNSYTEIRVVKGKKK